MILFEADDLLALLRSLAKEKGVAAPFDQRAINVALEAFQEAEQREAPVRRRSPRRR